MDDLINAVTGAVQSIEQLSSSTMDTALQALSQKVKETSALKEKQKNEFDKKMAAFKDVVVNHFSEIDKQELYNVLTELTSQVSKNEEKSYKEAMKTMDNFVKKHRKKK